MAVSKNTGKENNSIGLIAVSSLQGWLSHKPKTIQEDGVVYEQPGAGASILRRLLATLTFMSPKSAFGYVINGHTALMARVDGEITKVIGYNPKDYVATAFLKYEKGYRIVVPGQWYDDIRMIDDPTAVSHEIPVTLDQAQRFAELINRLKGRPDLGKFSPSKFPTFYSFQPASTETAADIVGNCGNMAFMILCAYLYELNLVTEASKLISWVRSTKSTRNFGQGPMMRAIATRFLPPKPKL
ncbi:MAG TPA: hypothetical protein VN493_16055 [Thermoanaerobaculia bacterium]|nr:hypothetical protein [Thermoanaerobaculia bacterium]